MASSNKISDALFDALTASSPEELKALGDAMVAFKTTYHRSYAGVKKQPFAAKLIDAIEQAVSYRTDQGDAK